jgi:hypothetical protein
VDGILGFGLPMPQLSRPPPVADDPFGGRRRSEWGDLHPLLLLLLLLLLTSLRAATTSAASCPCPCSSLSQTKINAIFQFQAARA